MKFFSKICVQITEGKSNLQINEDKSNNGSVEQFCLKKSEQTWQWFQFPLYYIKWEPNMRKLKMLS